MKRKREPEESVKCLINQNEGTIHGNETYFSFKNFNTFPAIAEIDSEIAFVSKKAPPFRTR